MSWMTEQWKHDLNWVFSLLLLLFGDDFLKCDKLSDFITAWCTQLEWVRNWKEKEIAQFDAKKGFFCERELLCDCFRRSALRFSFNVDNLTRKKSVKDTNWLTFRRLFNGEKERNEWKTSVFQLLTKIIFIELWNAAKRTSNCGQFKHSNRKTNVESSKPKKTNR